MRNVFIRLIAATASLVPAAAGAQSQPAQVPQPAVQSVHGAWEVRCFAANDCIMTQFHKRTDTSADAVFTVIKPEGIAGPDGVAVEALAEIVVPLGVYLPNGLGLQVDEGTPRAAPFERCIPDGCVVRAPISSGMIGQLKSGGTAYLVISRSPVETVKVPISLNGFTAAYDSF